MFAADMGLTSFTSLAFCRANFLLMASSCSSSSWKVDCKIVQEIYIQIYVHKTRRDLSPARTEWCFIHMSIDGSDCDMVQNSRRKHTTTSTFVYVDTLKDNLIVVGPSNVPHTNNNRLHVTSFTMLLFIYEKWCHKERKCVSNTYPPRFNTSRSFSVTWSSTFLFEITGLFVIVEY